MLLNVADAKRMLANLPDSALIAIQDGNNCEYAQLIESPSFMIQDDGSGVKVAVLYHTGDGQSVEVDPPPDEDELECSDGSDVDEFEEDPSSPEGF